MPRLPETGKIQHRMEGYVGKGESLDRKFKKPHV